MFSAEDAGLHYTNEEDLCYKRILKGKRFIYFNGDGKEITRKNLLERFRQLVIPPAWNNVLICADDSGHIQATGRDARGRKQYIYHREWTELSNSNKFERMPGFARVLPQLRKRIAADLKKKDLSREKVTAAIIRLLEETLIRVGNKIYAATNNSYGLTTLKDNHIKVDGSKLKFAFTGKSGKELRLDLKNKRVAKIIKQCQDIPGQHLFQYFDENGNRCRIDSNDINNYLSSVTGADFTAKDFRTWGGTITALNELTLYPLSENRKENEKNIVAVVKAVAGKLNNTPSVCRKYYIHPGLFESYLDGYLPKALEIASAKRNTRYGLNTEERALVYILKSLKKISRSLT
jgi:DNA topoisomerase-1